MIKKCVAHIRNLKQALNHGLKRKLFHRVIKFSQTQFLYIDINTELRKNAKTDFEKDMYKLK